MRMLDSATDAFATRTYPATTQELIDDHGEVELQLPNGTETLGDVLRRLTPETYQDAEEARLATYSAVSSKGIGRRYYSDRDPTAAGVNGPAQMSF